MSAIEKSYTEILNIPEEHTLKLIDKLVKRYNTRDDESFTFEETDKAGKFVAKYVVESNQLTNLNTASFGKNTNATLQGSSSIIKYDANGNSVILESKSF